MHNHPVAAADHAVSIPPWKGCPLPLRPQAVQRKRRQRCRWLQAVALRKRRQQRCQMRRLWATLAAPNAPRRAPVSARPPRAAGAARRTRANQPARARRMLVHATHITYAAHRTDHGGRLNDQPARMIIRQQTHVKIQIWWCMSCTHDVFDMKQCANAVAQRAITICACSFECTYVHDCCGGRLNST